MRRLAVVVCLLIAAPATGQDSPEGQDPPDAQDAPAFEEPPPGPASQPSAQASDEPGGTPLSVYLDALAERRLLAAETGSVERMRELVRRGEALYLDERYDEAALILFEVVESPRFADFVSADEFRGAEHMLARSLERLGALRTASRYLERIIERGPEDPYFGPAFRKFVDVALASGNPAAAIGRLEGLGLGLDLGALPEDAQNEVRYLNGFERYQAGELRAAADHFEDITRRSRFYPNGQYLRGVIAAREGELEDAENLFCTVAEQSDREQLTFYVDERYFEVKDLARLALGRVAHEAGRADDAFYYYFQVPADSHRVAEALFESAYAMYEGGDMDTAVDLLDQLEARFPESPFVDEAALLRGYVHLGRCEFEEANALFVRFATQFEPIVYEIDRILRSPARQQRLYAELLAEEQRLAERARRGEELEANPRTLLLAMLRVDPSFYRLHADVRTLDAEAARASRLGPELGAIAARVTGADAPRPAAELDDSWDESAELRDDIEAARAILANLTEQLDAMRRGRAPADQLRPLEQEVRALAERIEALEGRLDEATVEVASDDAAPAAGGDIGALLRRDLAHARRLPARVAATRARMVDAGNEHALAGLRELRGRLGGGLRRARIGRIDAVMGSKRRIEIQIESLAAGRFPPELLDPLSIQGLLRDDEEYWPFEGELWEDEFDEADPIEEILD
jgi:TolA-binding protein